MRVLGGIGTWLVGWLWLVFSLLTWAVIIAAWLVWLA